MKLRILNDVAFNYVFGRNNRKYNLINLLNAILAETGEPPIFDLILTETEFKSDKPRQKGCRLDIRAVTSQNYHINIEVQLFNQHNMGKRSIFYWSKLYTEQLGEGENFHELNKTIAINILDFAYLGNNQVHNIYKLLETKTRAQLSDTLEIHFLELPNLKQDSLDLDCPLTRWLLFLSDQTNDELKEEIIMKDENIKNANKDLSKLILDDAARHEYELREKAARDYDATISFAHDKGHEKGMDKGHKVASEQHAKKMLVNGLDDELIKEITGLTQAELDTLKQ